MLLRRTVHKCLSSHRQWPRLGSTRVTYNLCDQKKMRRRSCLLARTVQWEGLRRAGAVQSHCTSILLHIAGVAMLGRLHPGLLSVLSLWRAVDLSLLPVSWACMFQKSISWCWVLLACWGLRFDGAGFRPFCCFWLGCLLRLVLGMERRGIAPVPAVGEGLGIFTCSWRATPCGAEGE